MQFSERSAYAIHAVAYLAIRNPEAPIYLGDIAEWMREQGKNVSESYLSKVFQTLCKRGLVTAYRGAKGGYALARPASEISLYDIIEATDGPLDTTKCCLLVRGSCPRFKKCSVLASLNEAREKFVETLENQTVEEIARTM